MKKKLVFANNPLLSGPALSERDKVGIPYRVLDIHTIDRDPKQPRSTFDEEKMTELTQSIKLYGVLSPILVRPSNIAGRYLLISGERRLRASQRAGLKTIPALVDQREDASEPTTLAMQLVENLQRADLSPLERAHAIGALQDTHKLSVREIADRLGISKSMVQRSLDILNLPPDLLNALKEGASESKVLLLAKIDDETIRASYLKDLDSLTRTQIQRQLGKNLSEGKVIDINPEDRRITEEVQRALGLKVRMMRTAPGAESGRLIIDFYSNQDLQEVFRRLVSE